ncbi:MAG: hypothetical protein JXB35_12160 [Anaerolineae bacterium]|nr:hypothetical protein [Anaerolineae bacterium]
MGRACWRIRFLILALITLALGCGLSNTITLTPEDSDETPLTTPTATSTPTATPLPTAPPDPCPLPTNVTIPPRPSDVRFPDTYIASIQVFLSKGGGLGALTELLNEWEIMIPQGGLPLRADLTGDAIPETVIVFLDPLSETYPPAGALIVFACRDGGVEVKYTYLPGELLLVGLVGLEDMTADSVADLVFTETQCGAHTCWETLHVWSWVENDFVERTQGDPSWPYVTLALTEGSIVATSAGIGSVGAGPQRTLTETWSWNGSVITMTATQLGPAIFRYHAFRDGDEALFAGNYTAAFDAYVRVIRDEDLETWAGYYGATEEQLWFTALARWRRVSMGIHIGNFTDADEQYRQLLDDYTPETPGYPVVQMAERFWTTYAETGLVEPACREAIAPLDVMEVVDFLNSFGYANPTYTAFDLCPFQTP